MSGPRRRRLGLTRRQWLTAIGGLGATCTGLGAWRALSYPDLAAFRGLAAFSPRQGFILAAIVDTMLPEAAPRTPEVLVGHVQAIDRYCAGTEPGDRAQLGQLLYAVEHATPLDGHVRRFTSLGRAGRTDVLEDWQTSGMTLRRLGFRSLKALVFLAYYRAPAAWVAIDYPGPIRPGGGGSADDRARYAALAAPPGARPGFGTSP
jgi:hypothetical protein